MAAIPSRPLAAALAFALMTTATAASASDPAAMQARINDIEHEWAHITYQVKGDDQKEARLAALAVEADKLVAAYPGHAEPLIWDGVVTSSRARYSGMFSALSLAKRSREMLLRAARLDYRALDGAVPTSLGTLYFMVPGFPIGFGDDDKARHYLEQAVQISPDGLDSNYFYGDFLVDQEEYDKAAKVLRHALNAPANPDRPVWDAGRRAEARALLAKIEAKTAFNRSGD